MNVVDTGAGYPMVTLVNVSSTFNLNLNLNTNKIALTLKDLPVKLNKRKISGMILVTESALTQRTASLFYENGTAILTGACYEEMSRMCAWSVVSMLNRFGIPADMRDFSINNITGHFELDFKVDLLAAHENMDCKSEYNKDYTAMRIRKVKGMGNMSCLVYPNGKCVVTGVKTREMVVEAVRWLYPRLLKYKLSPDAGTLAPRAPSAAEGGWFDRFGAWPVVSGSEPAFVYEQSPEDALSADPGPGEACQGKPYMHTIPQGEGLKLFEKFGKRGAPYAPESERCRIKKMVKKETVE